MLLVQWKPIHIHCFLEGGEIQHHQYFNTLNRNYLYSLVALEVNGGMFVFLLERMNWPSEATWCFYQENGSTNNARQSRECKRKWLHSSVPHTFLCFTSWYSQHCWADIISALCERPLPNNTASYLSHEGKKRHKDWMSDTFVHFCVTGDRRSIRLVQLYWWNINKATMPLLKAGTSPVCTDLKPWQ